MRRLPPDSERPSRTRRKLAAEAVVELAHQLAALPDAAFKGLPLPQALRDEFVQVRKMKPCAARARQLRHLAGELRADDDLLAALGTALGGRLRSSREEALRFRQREEMRASLLDPHHGTAALYALEQSAPDLDHAALREQLERYRQTGDKRYYRAIFRLLEQGGAAHGSSGAVGQSG
jgi:ribosome-associated protein